MPRSRLPRRAAAPLLAAALALALIGAIVLAPGSALAAPHAAASDAAPSAAPAAVTADGASWSVAPADTAVGVGRANFDYAVDPGEVLVDAFQVRNDGAGPLTLRVYAADAFTTREGNIDLLAAGEPSTDAGTWVALDLADVTLQPGELAIIPFTLTVPADARPGDHPAGIVASLADVDPEAQVQVDRRLGSRMQIRVAGELSPSVEVSEVTLDFSGIWNPLALGSVTARYSLRNSGDTRIAAVSSLELAGPLGIAPARTGQVQLPEVLPGSEIDVQHELGGVGALLLLSGSLEVRPTSVGIGAAALDTVTVPVQLAAIPAAALLILLGLAAAVIGAALLVRRRRAARAMSPAAVSPGP